jgi:hypothetical protein
MFRSIGSLYFLMTLRLRVCEPVTVKEYLKANMKFSVRLFRSVSNIFLKQI